MKKHTGRHQKWQRCLFHSSARAILFNRFKHKSTTEMESTSPRTVKKLKIITPTGKRTELYRTPRLSVNKHIVHGRTFVKYPAEVASPIESECVNWQC